MRKLILTAVFLASQALVFPATAQDKTRAEVKAEAAAAAKAGQIPTGEATADKAPPKSNLTPQEKADARAKRKAEAISAVKAGEGNTGEVALEKRAAKRTYTAKEKADARQKRKAEAAAALKSGQIPKSETSN